MMVKRWHVEKDSAIVLPPERELWGFSELLRLYTEGLYDRFKRLHIPTNGGWESIVSGSGSTSQEPFLLAVLTGTLASSSAMLRRAAHFLNSGTLSRYYVDWRKRLEWHFLLVRVNSDPEAVARVQLKEVKTEGALAGRGIGLEIQNLDVYGEGFGTSRGTVSLGSLTDDRITRCKIVLEDGRAEFWLDGTLKGELEGANVPSVEGTSIAYMVTSIINGPTGGVNAELLLGEVMFTQEW